MNKKFILVLITLIIFLILGGLYYVYNRYSNIYKNDDYNKESFIKSSNGDLAAEPVEFLNISYGSNEKHKFDVYSDKTFKNTPIIFIVHGGVTGDKSQFTDIAKYFNYLGYVSVNIEYRQIGDGYGFPVPINDIACAIATVKKDAEKYGGNRNGMFLYGHSLGAHFASNIAYNQDRNWLEGCSIKEDTADIKGFIGSSGLYDFDILNQQRFKDLQNYLNNIPTSDKWGVAEPVNYIDSKDPPALILAGSKDCFINKTAPNGSCSDMSIKFVEALNMKRIPATLKIFDGERHNDLKTKFNSIKGLKDSIVEFLDSLKG